MKNETMLNAISKLDTELIDRYFEIGSEMRREKKGRVKKAFLRWGAAAACAVVIFGAILMLRKGETGVGIISGDVVSETEDVGGVIPALIISGYSEDGVEYPNASYRSPSPGEIGCTIAVDEALDAYRGENAAFLLAIDMFKAEGEKHFLLSEEEESEEYSRLASLGYDFYTVNSWTYGENGEKENCEVNVICLTEEQFWSFMCNEKYGYFFRFVTNGDGSPISADESEIVTDFEGSGIA